ncbi:unnamed protein product, partial [marine sediment metagenome]
SLVNDTAVYVAKANHIGIQFTGGSLYCNIINGPKGFSYILSPSGVGVGIGLDFNNCDMCAITSRAITNLTTGIRFGAPANKETPVVQPDINVFPRK